MSTCMSGMKMRGLEESLVSVHTCSKAYALGDKNFVIKELSLKFLYMCTCKITIYMKLGCFHLPTGTKVAYMTCTCRCMYNVGTSHIHHTVYMYHNIVGKVAAELSMCIIHHLLSVCTCMCLMFLISGRLPWCLYLASFSEPCIS